MALYLFNLHIGGPTTNSYETSENIGFNEQENLVELLIEQVLGYENAIAENNDSNASEDPTKKEGKIDLVVLCGADFTGPLNLFENSVQRYPLESFRLDQGIFQVESPPPQA